MSSTAQAFLKSLQGTKTIDPDWNIALDAMTFEQLLDVFYGLEHGDPRVIFARQDERGGEDHIRPWAESSVSTRIIRRLALQFGTAGGLEIANILAAATLWEWEIGITKPKIAAMILAFANQTVMLEPLFKQFSRDKRLTFFLECLVQELVLQDSNFVPLPTIQAFWESRVQAGSKLTWLPLHRSPLESHFLAYCQFSVGDIKHLNKPQWSKNSTRFFAQPMPFEPIGFDHERIHRAIETWHGESPGKVLSIAAKLQNGYTALEAAVSLAWYAIENDRHNNKIEYAQASIISSQEALETLYTTAYLHGFGGANGRLKAWQSAAALLDLDSNARFEDVEAAAISAVWIHLGFESDWLYEDEYASNLGLGCIIGQNVTCLLATETI
jgi:Family of unknown function (DUF6183)